MNYEQRKSMINSVNDGNHLNIDGPDGERPHDRNCDVCGEEYDYYLSVDNKLCAICQADKDRRDYLEVI